MRVSPEIRAKSIRLRFTLDGVPHRPTLRDDDGMPMLPTPLNLKYAQRLAAEIERKAAIGTLAIGEYFPELAPDTTVTLGEHLDAWFGTVQRCAPSTLRSYSSAINFWKAALGDKALASITLTDLRTALAARPELSGKTVNNYTSVLREAYNLAVIEGVIETNASALLEAARWQKTPPDPFSRDEAEAIIAHMKTRDVQVANMVEWWFYTGVRTGEAFGLQWGSVDIYRATMSIHESVVAGEQRDSTKTGVARNAALNSRAISALTRQHDWQKGLGGDLGHVWVNPLTGTGWTDERAFRHGYWEPTLKALGIRYRRPYNMRHSYAAMMLMAGRTPAWCAKQLGHSVEMFLGTYSKWIDGEQDSREMAALENWIGEAA